MILWEGPSSVKLKSTETSDKNFVIKSVELPVHLAGETNVVELWSMRPLKPLMAFNVPTSLQCVDAPLPPASQRDIATLALLGSSPNLIQTTKVSRTALWQFEKVQTPCSFHRLLSHLTSRLRLGQSPYRVLVGPPHAPPCALVFHTSRASLEAVYSSARTYLGVLSICNFLVALLAAEDTPSRHLSLPTPVFTGSAQTGTGRYWIERRADLSAIVYSGFDGARWSYHITGTVHHHETASMILRGWLAVELSGELYRPRSCGVVSVANTGDCTGGDVGCALKDRLKRFVPLASGVGMETTDMWLVPDASHSVSFKDTPFSILQLLMNPDLSEANIETLRILNKLSETCSPTIVKKASGSAESSTNVSVPYASNAEIDTVDTSTSGKFNIAPPTRQGSLVILTEQEYPPTRGWSGVLPLTPEICEADTSDSVVSGSSMLQELDLLCMSGSEDESSQGMELPIRITGPETLPDVDRAPSKCLEGLPSDWSMTESQSERRFSQRVLALSTASRDWEAQPPSPRANRVHELFWNLREQVPNSAETLFSEISAELEPEVKEPSSIETPSSQGSPTWPAVCPYTYGLPAPPHTSDFWSTTLSPWDIADDDKNFLSPTYRPKFFNQCTFEPFPLHASRLMLDAAREPLHQGDVASMMLALRKPEEVREPGAPDYLRSYDGEDSIKNQLRSIRADLLYVTGLLDAEDVPADVLTRSRDLLYLLALKLHECIRNGHD